MKVGNLKEKASRGLVFFVLSCAVITTGLLYILQKSTALAVSLAYDEERYVSR